MLKSLISNPSQGRRALFGAVALLIGCGVQTTLSLRSNAAVSSPLRVGAETYSYGDAEWQQLTETPGKVGPVVISPSTGPGASQNSDFLDRVQRAQAAGQTVYGFITVSGTTPKAQAAVVAEANLYKTFYGVDGIYLAGVSTGPVCGPSGYLSLVAADIRTNVGISKIGINAYGEPNACVESLVDLVHIPFSNPTAYATYANLGSPSWTAGLAPGSTLQIWHSVNNTAAEQVAAVKTTSLSTSASFLSTSDSVPLTSAYWTQMVTDIAGTYTPAPLGLGTVTDQKFAMPTYFNDAAQWATITAIGPQFSLAVLNPNSGPGAAKDNTIAAHVLAAQAQGIKVLGYVSTNYHGLFINGTPNIPIYDVPLAVSHYLNWYGVDGIFFDEAVYECSQTSYLAGYVQGLKSAKPLGIAIVNPGRNSGECLVAPTGVGAIPGAVGADVSVNFEGSAATYETWQPSFWTRNYPASKFWHIVYSTPAAAVAQVVFLSKLRQGGLLFSSDLSALVGPNAFASIPATTYLNLLRSSIYGSVVNGSTTTSAPASSTRLPASFAPSPIQAPANARATAPMSNTCTTCASGRAPAPQS
jgi:Spherulation-specific family 4